VLDILAIRAAQVAVLVAIYLAPTYLMQVLLAAPIPALLGAAARGVQ
jgi:hypothetical protein